MMALSRTGRVSGRKAGTNVTISIRAMALAGACASLAVSAFATPAFANSAAVDYFRSRADRTAVPALLSQDEREYYRDLFAAIDSKN